MSRYVSDTHALHWHLTSNPKLSTRAARMFQAADAGYDQIYAVAPLDLAVAQALQQVPRTLVPEMPDRIITATALALALPLITRDGAIQQSALVPTIWD